MGLVEISFWLIDRCAGFSTQAYSWPLTNALFPKSTSLLSPEFYSKLLKAIAAGILRQPRFLPPVVHALYNPLEYGLDLCVLKGITHVSFIAEGIIVDVIKISNQLG